MGYSNPVVADALILDLKVRDVLFLGVELAYFILFYKSAQSLMVELRTERLGGYGWYQSFSSSTCLPPHSASINSLLLSCRRWGREGVPTSVFHSPARVRTLAVDFHSWG